MFILFSFIDSKCVKIPSMFVFTNTVL